MTVPLIPNNVVFVGLTQSLMILKEVMMMMMMMMMATFMIALMMIMVIMKTILGILFSSVC